MNQSFDLNRWWLLVGKHWSENRKKYTLALIAIGGLLLVWFFFVIATDRHRPMHLNLQAITYFFGLMVVGCFYASMIFSELASKSKGINYLSVPASHLEKLLCAIFFASVAFFVCYTTIFYAVDIIMVKISNAIAFTNWEKHPIAGATFEPEEVLNIFHKSKKLDGSDHMFLYLLLVFATAQSAFILGSVYFPKFSLIKTVIALILIGLFFVFLVAKIIPSFMPEGGYYRSMTSYMFAADRMPGKIVMLPEWINSTLEFIVKYVFAPIFWLTSYFRLKEKEI